VTVTGEVAAIAAGYGIRPGRVRPLPPGVANAVYLLGDDLVLRVPRSAGYAADLRKEAALLPHLLGLRTTRLVAFAEEPAARVLWHHLVWALGRISDRVPRPGERHWSAPPAARLIDVLGGLSTDPWRRL
jgi:hypothetical protein